MIPAAMVQMWLLWLFLGSVPSPSPLIPGPRLHCPWKYILGESNEVLVVGVDIRLLDVDEK